MAKGRSKSHPGLNLQESLNQAKQLYLAEGETFVHLTKVAFSHWGYQEKSSGGRRTAAALLGFGLLLEQGRGQDREVAVSPLAAAIILDERPNSEERQSAIQKAALQPELYRDLWESSGKRMPSEVRIRDFCLREHRFNPAGIEEFIANFTETVQFANLAQGPILEADNEGKSADSHDGTGDMDPPRSTLPASEGSKAMPTAQHGEGTEIHDFHIPLDAGEAILRLPKPLSKDDYTLLVEAIGVQLKLFRKQLTKGEAVDLDVEAAMDSWHKDEPAEGQE